MNQGGTIGLEIEAAQAHQSDSHVSVRAPPNIIVSHSGLNVLIRKFL